MTPSLSELAEDTLAYLQPSPMFEPVEGDGCVYVVDRSALYVTRVRRVDREAARAAARARGIARVEWWLGPSSPPGARDALLAEGLVPDEVPTLTGMTCAQEPPGAPVEVRRIGTPEEYLDAVAVDSEVWRLPPEERARRLAEGGERFEACEASGAVHHFAAYLDGALVGFGRAVDMTDGVALLGGAVLPQARGRGAYRALVRARWEHAAARGTPLLVVQAGDMSAPVLDGLGFVRHCTLGLLVDTA